MKYSGIATLLFVLSLCSTEAFVVAAERSDGRVNSPQSDRTSARQSGSVQRQVTPKVKIPIDSKTMNLENMKLQVRLQSGDFEQWGTAKVVDDLSVPLTLRWGNPLKAGAVRVQVAKHPFFVEGSIVYSNVVTNQNEGENAWSQTALDLQAALPAQATDGGAEYHIRLVPTSSGLRATNRVTIDYRRSQAAEEFPIGAFYPQLFTPMPTFVDLQRLIIHAADEDNDEEPFIIPLVIYFDDTLMNLPDLANSSVRVRAYTGPPHGNIPRYNDSLGAGDSVAIADSVGRFEESIVPLFFTQPQSTVNAYTKLFLRGVTESQLMRSTNIFVIVLAFEEDSTSGEAATAARDVVVGFFDSELNRCLHEMSLLDVQNLAANGGTFQDVLSDANADLCGYQASEENGTILDQLVAKLNGLAEDAAIAEELDGALQWFPHNPALLAKLDHDDFIGFSWRSFSYEQIARAQGPIGFTMEFDKTWVPTGQAGTTRAHYEIQGQVGRCAAPPAPGTTSCQTAFDPWIN